jgi:hypothetical protein
MELIVSAAGLELSPQTIRSLSQRLDLAVDRLETVLKKITVHLERKLPSHSETTTVRQRQFELACWIQLTLESNEPIELEDMDNNLVELLDRITERLGVIVSKRADEKNLASMIRRSRRLQSYKSSESRKGIVSLLPNDSLVSLP